MTGGRIGFMVNCVFVADKMVIITFHFCSSDFKVSNIVHEWVTCIPYSQKSLSIIYSTYVKE